jgi:ubiquinone biosynthesis protein
MDVPSLGRDVMEPVQTQDLGHPPGEVFAEIDWEPIGSASIGQVYRARLNSGDRVVVKLRRPGIAETFDQDIAIVMNLTRVAERRTAWGAR